jgi:hypothetical protein
MSIDSDPITLPWPLSTLYTHATIVSEHTLKTIDALYELYTPKGSTNEDTVGKEGVTGGNNLPNEVNTDVSDGAGGGGWR